MEPRKSTQSTMKLSMYIQTHAETWLLTHAVS